MKGYFHEPDSISASSRLRFSRGGVRVSFVTLYSQGDEYKVVALRECPTPQDLALCDTPDKAAGYWRRHVEQHPYFNPDVECFVALILNTRRKVKGHYLQGRRI